MQRWVGGVQTPHDFAPFDLPSCIQQCYSPPWFILLIFPIAFQGVGRTPAHAGVGSVCAFHLDTHCLLNVLVGSIVRRGFGGHVTL